VAAVDKKILERIEKLLHMAGPKSGAAETERQIAASEAIKLFNEHDLVVREREQRPKRRGQPRTRQSTSTPSSTVYEQPPPPPGYNPSAYPSDVYPSRPASMPGAEWTKAHAPYDTICLLPGCGELISEGDPTWVRLKNGVFEFLHADRTGSCGW